jgi:putative GTP pyrophosphokinase
MAKDLVAELLRNYEQQYPVYCAFTERVEKLISEFLREKDVHVHSIASRVKEKDSLRNKLSRSDVGYLSLRDVTDISGIRIITYFGNEVDIVAKLIEEEFDVDRVNSVDKRALLDPDRFGYLSLHYIAMLPDIRLKLTEYRRFADLKVEIQIRSILQHTWAEIEHDLGYKNQQSVPKEVRRRFSRLAGLLEIADTEFVQIRDSLQAYAKAIPQRIDTAPEDVSIDRDSLFAFVKANARVKELDQRIASIVKAPIIEGDQKWLSYAVKELRHVGLETIADVSRALDEFGDVTVRFWELWIAESRVQKIPAGFCVFYLCYVLVGRHGSFEKALDYVRENNIDVPDKQGLIAEKIVSLYTKATTPST